MLESMVPIPRRLLHKAFYLLSCKVLSLPSQI